MAQHRDAAWSVAFKYKTQTYRIDVPYTLCLRKLFSLQIWLLLISITTRDFHSSRFSIKKEKGGGIEKWKVDVDKGSRSPLPKKPISEQSLLLSRLAAVLSLPQSLSGSRRNREASFVNLTDNFTEPLAIGRTSRGTINDIVSRNITMVLENLLMNYENSQLPTHGKGELLLWIECVIWYSKSYKYSCSNLTFIHFPWWDINKLKEFVK